jgi:WD40-like Beta Propeller Repeat
MRYLYLKLIFTLCLSAFSIQNKAQNFKKLITLGDEAFETKDYYSAKQFYKGAYLRDSNDLVLSQKLAQTAYLAYDFGYAEYLYKKIIKKDNGKNYPKTFLDYANVLKAIGKYKDANAQYNKYIKKQSTKILRETNKEDIQVCKNQIAACASALAEQKEKTAIAVTRLDSNISTVYSELGGQFINPQTIIYSKPLIQNRTAEGNEVRYEVIKKENINENKNKKTFNTILSDPKYSYANFSYDSLANLAVCSKCVFEKTNENCRIIALKKVNDKWIEAIDLLEKIKPSATQGQLTRINGTLILFYAMENGKFGTDLYQSTFTDNVFQIGNTLSDNINTPYNEITPYYSSTDKTLFFSSNRIDGIGGYDIYQSKLVDNRFEKAVRLKQPYNSAYNDMYFSVEEKSRKALITSNRKGAYTLYDEGCCNDLFLSNYPLDTNFAKPIDTIQTLVNKIKLISPLSLFFDNDEPDKRTTAVTTTKTYETAYNNYITKKSDYVTNYSEDLEIDKKIFAKDAIELFFEDSVEQGMSNLNLFCNTLYEIVKSGKQVKVILKAYTSSLASNAYNSNLAARRIYSLKNYFEVFGNSKLLPYMNLADTTIKGKVEVIELKIGELALPNSSEDLEDLRNSVYSPNAMAERKIEIISIELE